MDRSRIQIAKPIVGDDEARAVADVIASGNIASGPRVAAFEAAFARYVGVDYAVATANATVGLHAALVGLGVGPGHEVIVPAFTFVASANAVLFAGAKPVLVDIDPTSFNLDPSRVSAAISDRTKAIMPVHLYGHPAEMDVLSEIADRHDIRIIGDAAQAHGAAIGTRKIGSFGDCECFSFYPTKNMTTAEGGIVTTNNPAIAARVRSFVNHGRAKSELGTYDHVALGHNFRMTDVHAAIGLVQLSKLDGWNAKRQTNARQLGVGLRDSGLTLPSIRAGTSHVFHQYTIRARNRAGLIKRLDSASIGFGVYYPKPLQSYPHLSRFAPFKTPEAERAAAEVISLPVHPSLSSADVDRIVAVVS